MSIFPVSVPHFTSSRLYTYTHKHKPDKYSLSANIITNLFMECFSWCYCMGNETAFIGTHTIATRGGFNESKPKIVSKRNPCGWWKKSMRWFVHTECAAYERNGKIFGHILKRLKTENFSPEMNYSWCRITVELYGLDDVNNNLGRCLSATVHATDSIWTACAPCTFFSMLIIIH